MLGKVKSWYMEHERHVSTGSLLFGFVFDSLTLQRIDSLRENLWLGANIILAASLILTLSRMEAGREERPRLHFWLATILQFSLGAILGGLFIFYFRSAALSAAWPFLLLLLGAMAANEFLQKRWERLAFQIGFLYFSIFLFLIFLVPVLMHKIGAPVFLLSGLLSLAVFWLFYKVLERFARSSFERGKVVLVKTVAGVFIGMNILYFTNLIPPIPLSLKDAGIYHSVSRTAEGYRAVDDDFGWRRFLHLRERFNLANGSEAYAYSSVFAPSDFSTQVVHVWQYEDGDDRWTTSSRVPLSVSGGRGGGFRTFSTKSSLTPGKWRVNVETPRGQLIGRIIFKVVDKTGSSQTSTVVLE